MMLLTKADAKRLPYYGSTTKTPLPEKIAIVKFFHPLSNWTWYAIEYDPVDRVFWGWVVGHEKEFGPFSLDEMEQTKVKGLGMERDRSFQPTKIKDLPEWNEENNPYWEGV